MKIEFYNFIRTAAFKYLWLKYVTGVSLSIHCAGCLKGSYTQKLNRDLEAAEKLVFDEFDANILYFCGVSRPYKWENNFHLALQFSEGESISVDRHGLKFEVKNAIEIEITTSAMKEVNHPKIIEKPYSTCRNWQFANFLSKNPQLLQKQH